MIRAVALALVLAAPGAAAQDIRFSDRAGAIPTHVYSGGWEHFVGGGVAVFDCSGDGLPELYIAGGAGPAALWRNVSSAETGIAFEEAATAPLTGVTGAYPLDIDGDGRLDLFVMRVGENRILLGEGDCRFRDGGPELGHVPTGGWTTAFSATWEAGRDLPTLAIGNYVDRDDPEGPFGACDANRLLRPVGRRYGAATGLEPGFCALSMLFSDWQRQGRADLRISNDRHYYLRGGSEQMWRLSEGRFLDAADGWDDLSIWGMGIASRDINDDAKPDVMLTSMGDQLLLFSTKGNGFEAAPYDLGATAHRPHAGDDGRPSTGWHAQFGDVDNDGRADLFVTKGNVDQMPSNAIRDPNNLLWQDPDGRFVEVSVAAGVASDHRGRGGALADLDGDGRLDIVVVNRRAPVEVYQNITKGAGNAVTVALRMPAPNTRAVGAWVELRGGGGTQRQEITVGGGHAGGQALPLHFGIGPAEAAEVRAIWPDGTTGAWHPVRANATLTLGRDAEGRETLSGF